MLPINGLILLPNVLDETLSHEAYLPSSVERAVQTLDGIFAESEKGARHYLKRFAFPHPRTFRDIAISLLNEHTTDKEREELLEPLKRGETWGIVSDCGLPVLADPGATLVYRANELGIPVSVFPGPSSIIYALMLSGLSGQNFAFNGYLPRKEPFLQEKIQSLVQISQKEKQTQIFIEAPYRTEKMLELLVKELPSTAILSLSWNLTLPTQGVITKSIKEWKKHPLPELRKTPAVFVFTC